VPYIHYYIYYNSYYYIISLACAAFVGVVWAFRVACGVLYAFGLCIALYRLCGRCAVWTLALCASCAVGRCHVHRQCWTCCRVPCCRVLGWRCVVLLACASLRLALCLFFSVYSLPNNDETLCKNIHSF
jgi:hypothetical protein